MSEWWPAERISEHYVVGENRLMAYSARGNLPSRRDGQGRWLFDVDVVRSLFRCRDAAMAPDLPAGTLGAVKLGDEWNDARNPGKRRRGRVRRRKAAAARETSVVTTLQTRVG